MSNTNLPLVSIVRLVVLDKVQSIILRDNIDTAHPVFMSHPVYLVSNFDKLWSKCCGYKLSARHVCQATDHIYRYSSKGSIEIHTYQNSQMDEADSDIS